MAASKDVDHDGSRYPLRRAFLMLSLPFTVLLIFVLVVVFGGGEGSSKDELDPSDAVERRMDGIRATPQSDAGFLVDAWDRDPGEWSPEQVTAFRELAARTGWPDEDSRATGVTRSILLESDPSEWNEAERASAKRLLALFERYWFRPSNR